MKKLSIIVNNLEETELLEKLFQSMISKSLDKYQFITEVLVEVSSSEDSRVPYEVTIVASLSDGSEIKTSAGSANHIAAFTQALSRMERRMVKNQAVRRA